MNMEFERRFIQALTSLTKDEIDQLSMPFFTSTPEGFRRDLPVYLYVGQETFGWGAAQGYLDSPDRTAGARADYVGFALAAGSPGYAPLTHTPFWLMHRKLARTLGIPHQNLIWTNLVRFDGYRRKSRTGSLVTHAFPSLGRLLEAQKGMLEREIVDFNVRGVIFVTGPNYDGVLKDQLAVADMQPMHPEIEERALARIHLTDFPNLPAVRTYHPSYLRRRKLEDAFFPLLVDGLTPAA
jgi:hypothetical protein